MSKMALEAMTVWIGPGWSGMVQDSLGDSRTIWEGPGLSGRVKDGIEGSMGGSRVHSNIGGCRMVWVDS